MPFEPQEASLYLAWRGWHSLLECGDLNEAVRVSASYHPRYHFLESRLHTERGFARAAQGDSTGAEADFRRAVMLDHINASAIAALEALGQGKSPDALPYDKESFGLSAWAEAQALPGLPSIHALAMAGQFSDAIVLCDATHRHYHRLAALPWLARAQAFLRDNQPELAKNDAHRGLDLDRENAALRALLSAL